MSFDPCPVEYDTRKYYSDDVPEIDEDEAYERQREEDCDE